MRILAIALGFQLSLFEVTGFLSRTFGTVETDHRSFISQQVYQPHIFHNNPYGHTLAPYNNQVRGPTRRPTHLMGLFGLGFGEIAIIAIIIGFLLGPEKIIDLLRSSGSTANEFKQELSKVPDEFKKGMEEGEVEVRARKAKRIKVIGRNEDDDEADVSQS